MNLPTWADCQEKLDRGEELNHLERFIYDCEDPAYDEKWRKQLLAAIRHVTALPKSCGECPVVKGCREIIKSPLCKVRYFDYINQ